MHNTLVLSSPIESSIWWKPVTIAANVIKGYSSNVERTNSHLTPHLPSSDSSSQVISESAPIDSYQIVATTVSFSKLPFCYHCQPDSNMYLCTKFIRPETPLYKILVTKGKKKKGKEAREILPPEKTIPPLHRKETVVCMPLARSLIHRPHGLTICMHARPSVLRSFVPPPPPVTFMAAHNLIPPPTEDRNPCNLPTLLALNPTDLIDIAPKSVDMRSQSIGCIQEDRGRGKDHMTCTEVSQMWGFPSLLCVERRFPLGSYDRTDIHRSQSMCNLSGERASGCWIILSREMD